MPHMPRSRFNGVVIGAAFVLGALFGRFVWEANDEPPTAGRSDSTVSASRTRASEDPRDASPPESASHVRGPAAFLETRGPVENSNSAAPPPPEQTTVSTRTERSVSEPPGDPEQLFAGGEMSSSRDTDTEAVDDRAKLHDAYRLSCQFGPGVNARVGSGAIQTSDAAWQGGIITYDVIDAASGRATMTGTAGATGASTGMVEVRLAGTAAGLSFSSVVPRGDLISTTVFTQRNGHGEFLAVMSTHAAGTGHMASQFYGACNVQ